MSDIVQRIEEVMREELARQAKADDVLLYDARSGMVDGVIDLHGLADALAQALLSDQFA